MAFSYVLWDCQNKTKERASSWKEISVLLISSARTEHLSTGKLLKYKSHHFQVYHWRGGKWKANVLICRLIILNEAMHFLSVQAELAGKHFWLSCTPEFSVSTDTLFLLLPELHRHFTGRTAWCRPGDVRWWVTQGVNLCSEIKTLD